MQAVKLASFPVTRFPAPRQLVSRTAACHLAVAILEGAVMDVDLLDAASAARPAGLIVRNGRLVNVFTEEIYPADVAVAGERIVAVGDVSEWAGDETLIIDAAGRHLVPGLIDGHIHLECSKLSVTMFASTVVPFGTTTVISGLDQVFVVAGLEGVREFLDEARQGPLSVFWAAPAKMPYTFPESTVGFTFGPGEHSIAQGWPECVGIWETVQEFITERDDKVLAALDLAARNRLPVFGCAPWPPARGSRPCCAPVSGPTTNAIRLPRRWRSSGAACM